MSLRRETSESHIRVLGFALITLTLLVVTGCSETENKNGSTEDAGDVAMDAESDTEDGDDVEMDVSACDPACEGDTPLCDEASGECVECETAEDCAGDDVCSEAGQCVACTESTGCGGDEVCAVDDANAANNVCAACVEDGDCTEAVCDDGGDDEPTNNVCVECLADADCAEATSSTCDTTTNTCAACTSNDDCAGIAAGEVCDTSGSAGECVECTGTDYDDCTGVCDSHQRTCTQMPAGQLGLCESCVSDAQCREGMVCVSMEYGDPAEEVGTFCLWKRDASVADAPDGACSRVAPYIDQVTTPSLDSADALPVCFLNVTTCPALNDYQTSCPTPGETSTCGDPNLEDGLCVMFDAASNKCTVPCGGSDDCKAGFSCDTTVTPNRCEL